jgi:hypothetical protein
MLTKNPSCSKLEANTRVEGGSKPAVVLFGFGQLAQLTEAGTQYWAVPSPPLRSVREAIKMGGRHIGQRLVPWGLQSDKSGSELFFRVVSDGNGEFMKSSDDRTLKQKHIFETEISSWGYKLLDNIVQRK